MDYLPPRPADLADVYALNHALLNCLRSPAGCEHLIAELAPALQERVRALADIEIRRLAAAPFLLLTLRERDAVYWSRLLGDDATQRELAFDHTPHNERCSIVAATIGFVWQLAKRNPYTARLVCGATLNWCEALASRPLFEVLRRAVDRDDLLALRFVDHEIIWGRLLGAGLSPDAAVRNAAQLAALQAMLTDSVGLDYRRLRAAACNTPVPTSNV